MLSVLTAGYASGSPEHITGPRPKQKSHQLRELSFLGLPKVSFCVGQRDSPSLLQACYSETYHVATKNEAFKSSNHGSFTYVCSLSSLLTL